MTFATIKKRNGDIVEFQPEKILKAVEKAFAATMTPYTKDDIDAITLSVVEKAETFFDNEHSPKVEDVQDMVEKTLMEKGFFGVAKSYILYRSEHAKERAEKQKETLEKIEKKSLFVTKKSGKKEKFDEQKVRNTLAHATEGYESVVDVESLVTACKESLYEGIETKDIAKALIMTVRSFIEQDPAFSFITARLLLNKLYREVIGDEYDAKRLDAQYRSTFVENMKKGVDLGVLTPDILKYDMKQMAAALDPKRDLLFMYLGLQTLYDRYFSRDAKTGIIFENPQAFWMRVAMGLAINEKNKEERAVEFYNLISTLLFVPSTPTLFHSGTTHPQLSSCYLTTIGDDLEHIFKSIGDNAQLSKWSGGLGNDWTDVRGTGALIKKTGVESQGVIPFLKIANDTTVAINRSGKRRGATCAYLESWHYDIEEFLELRKNTGDERRRTHDMNTANWVPDLLMKRVREDGNWTLFSPDETPDLHHLYGKKFEERYSTYEKMVTEGNIRLFKTMKARDLWKKMITMLFETGHPWITFKDPCNIRSPQDHVGVVHSSNLCTEITLNTSKDETAVCNLGSVNLVYHIKDKKLNQELVASTVKTAMRMLDNVVDVNFYPTKEAAYSNIKHRPVGLGIMGFQDALYLMDVNFDSEACVSFADESMEVVAYHAIMASSEIAKEKGTYETYKGSKWDRGIFPVDTIALLEQERGLPIDMLRGGKLDWTPVRESVKKYGMRNSNCMAIAPTATISNIAGVLPSIEPIYKNIYVKSNQGGEFIIVNDYLVEELKANKLWDYEMLGKIKYHDGSIKDISEIPAHIKEKYKEVFEIDPVWLIRAAAYRGKWIDQSQSLNIFFKGTSGKDISNLYLYAWEAGLKTTYYLRTLAISQVEKSTVSTAEYGSTHKREFLAMKMQTMPQQQAAPVVASVNSGQAASVVEKIEEAIASVQGPSLNPSFASASSAPKIYTSKNGTKLCAIEDPTCEACQ